MRALDDQVLALLRAGGAPLNVHDGAAPVDRTDPKVITADLPFVVYTSDTPVDGPETYDGATTVRDMEFDLMYVGADRNQAKAAGERAESRIHRISPGAGRGIIRKVDSLKVREEETYTGIGGARLFYGVDRYRVTV